MAGGASRSRAAAQTAQCTAKASVVVRLNLPQTWVLRQSSQCAERLVSRNLRKRSGSAARSHDPGLSLPY
jgi:hypothetical protein